MILYELPVIFTAYNKKRRSPLISALHAYPADFVPFDQAYQATDWSVYESMPPFTQCGDLTGHVKKVTGIDISRKLLAIAEHRKAERKLDNIEFIKTSLYDERLKAECFDIVMAFYFLNYFEDLDAVVKRIHALLKPGGFYPDD